MLARKQYSKAEAAAWRDAGPPLFDELVGPGKWQMDESDYGFTIGVGFQAASGKLRAVYLAKVDRREHVPDGANESFVLTLDEARAAIVEALNG